MTRKLSVTESRKLPQFLGTLPRDGSEEFPAWQADMEKAHGKAEIIIGKQRHGPTGTIELAFEAEMTRFSNLAREESLPQHF